MHSYAFFVRILAYYIRKYFKGPLLHMRQVLETEGSLGMMKTAFLFHRKRSFFFLKYLKFCPDFWS